MKKENKENQKRMFEAFVLGFGKPSPKAKQKQGTRAGQPIQPAHTPTPTINPQIMEYPSGEAEKQALIRKVFGKVVTPSGNGASSKNRLPIPPLFNQSTEKVEGASIPNLNGKQVKKGITEKIVSKEIAPEEMVSEKIVPREIVPKEIISGKIAYQQEKETILEELRKIKANASAFEMTDNNQNDVLEQTQVYHFTLREKPSSVKTVNAPKQTGKLERPIEKRKRVQEQVEKFWGTQNESDFVSDIPLPPRRKGSFIEEPSPKRSTLHRNKNKFNDVKKEKEKKEKEKREKEKKEERERREREEKRRREERDRKERKEREGKERKERKEKKRREGKERNTFEALAKEPVQILPDWVKRFLSTTAIMFGFAAIIGIIFYVFFQSNDWGNQPDEKQPSSVVEKKKQEDDNLNFPIEEDFLGKAMEEEDSEEPMAEDNYDADGNDNVTSNEAYEIRTHIVASGESLSTISMQHYGTTNEVTRIMEHNQLLSDNIYEGQTLEIPIPIN